MFGRRRAIVMLIAAAAAISAGPAMAQEDLTRGKTPAQLYASDCAECHRNPRALGNRENANSLASFLRVHYTASRESAGALARYLVALGGDPRGARPSSSSSQRQRSGATREQKKPAEAAKPSEESKPAEETPKPPQPVPEAPASVPAAETPAPAAAPPAAAEPQ